MMKDDVMENEKYRVVRDDGRLYMECDRETALRLVGHLNKEYEGVYTYKMEKADE